jgi:hypothetical protein
MHLDLTITLGNVLTIVGMVGAVFIAYSKLREQLIAIDTKLAPLWSEFTERRARARRQEDRE